MSFMLVMENEEHEVVAVATFIHLAPSIPEQYYYTDSNWNTYSYTDWLIVNFNAGYEGN